MQHKHLQLVAEAPISPQLHSFAFTASQGVMETDRFKQGWEKLKEIGGNAGEKVVDSLKDIAPDLGRYIVEFAYGDVYSRGVLSLKEREIATISALTALGNAQPQLKVHVHGALNCGCTRQEVVEVMMHMALYAGFPASLNGVFAAKEVFAERDKAGIKEAPAVPVKATANQASPSKNKGCHSV